MKNALLALVLAVAAQPAAVRAHHSFASEFDANQPVSLKGIVTMVEFINPHSWIHIDVADTEGKVANWSIEMDPASHLAREGWRSTLLKPGDKISVVVYPLRNDEKGGQYISVTLADGTKLGGRDDGVI